MKLNKFNFKSFSDILDDVVFLERIDGIITLIKIKNVKDEKTYFIRDSVPVVKFAIHVEKRKIVLSDSFETYERLMTLHIIDEAVEEPLLKKAYNDFLSQYTKYVLTGKIDVTR